MHCGFKVLIVDDSDFDRELCGHLLASAAPRHLVVTASTCQETLNELYNSPDIECILLDLHLPDGLGNGILESIRSLRPHVAVVMLTVESDMNVALTCLQQGADDYLIKGEFGAAMLDRTIRYAVERRKAHLQQQELMLALKHEQELNTTHKEFICLVAHEFKTPLGIISGAVQLLQASAEQPALLERQCKKIGTAIGRLNGLMDNVLMLHKLEDSRLAGSASSFDVIAIANNALALAHVSEARVELQCDAQKLAVSGNAALCEYTLSNIISNALKYSSGDSLIEIKITADDMFANICVSDHGIGMNNETLARIGERFMRGEGTFTHPGIGLGLYLATQFASHNGGALYICSEEKKGTRVMLKWPLQQREAALRVAS